MKLLKREKELDKEIREVNELMSTWSPDSEEYTAMVENLEVLAKIKASDQSRNRVSMDTMAIVAGNLAGIVMILGFEKMNVIYSKALGFVIRGRV